MTFEEKIEQMLLHAGCSEGTYYIWIVTPDGRVECEVTMHRGCMMRRGFIERKLSVAPSLRSD